MALEPARARSMQTLLSSQLFFRIPDFIELKAKGKFDYKSSNFVDVLGVKWRLTVYPNDRANKEIGVYLRPTSLPEGKSVKAKFELSVVGPTNEHKRCLNHKFTGSQNGVGRSPFISHESLANYLQKDGALVVCGRIVSAVAEEEEVENMD